MNFISRMFKKLCMSLPFCIFIGIVLIALGIDLLFKSKFIHDTFGFVIIQNTSESLFETIFGVTATIVTLQTVLLPMILEKSNRLVSVCSFVEVFKIDAWPFNPYHLIYISIACIPIQYYFSAMNMVGALVFIFLICCFILFFLFYSTISLSNQYTPEMIIKYSSVRAIRKNKKKLWNYIFNCINNRIVKGLLLNNDAFSKQNSYNIIEWLDFIYLNSKPDEECSQDIETLVINLANYSHLDNVIIMLFAFIKFYNDDIEIIKNYYNDDIDLFIQKKHNCLLINHNILKPLLTRTVMEKNNIDKAYLHVITVLEDIPLVNESYSFEINELRR